MTRSPKIQIEKMSPESEKTLDRILVKLTSLVDYNEVRGSVVLKKRLSIQEIYFLCSEAIKHFLREPPLLQLVSPLKLVGDVHGQFEDLLRLFKSGGFPPSSNYVFLGDYVDRGAQSVETISLLLAFKLKFPRNFFLLRGNHESSSVNKFYGFFEEISVLYCKKAWRFFAECFNCMPVSALIDKKIFCTHGGISPYLNSISDINKIRRPLVVPDEGLLCDLLWSDPNKNKSGWYKNTRGTSYTFGSDVLEEKCRELGIDLIVRAHQMVPKGYEFPDGRHMITVFSAPNYVKDIDNWGCYLNVNENLRLNFNILMPKNTPGGKCIK